MFKRLEAVADQIGRAPVRITIDGAEFDCRQGDSVAAALFASGHMACRDTAIAEAPRGPYCMMGICYDCLVTIDGRPNSQACMTPVREGMHVERQRGAREVRS